MFWGLIMEPQKRYSQVIKKAFHVSMACLDVSHSDDQPAQILCGYEGKNYLLCTLQKPDKLQCHLDLYFEEGHSVSFASNGKSLIHLTGYLTKEIEEEETDGESDEEEFEVMAKKKPRKAADSPEKEPSVKKIKLDYLFNNINEESESDDADFDIEKLLEEEEDSGEEESGEDEQNEEEESVSEEEDDDDEEEEAEEEETDEEEEDDEAEEQVEQEKVNQNGVSKKEKKNKKKKVETSSDELEPSTPTKKNKQPKEKHQLTPGPNAKKLEKPASGNKDKAKKGNESKSPTPKRRVLANGVIVEDLRVGQGNAATDGKFIHVYYEGRLQNNKVFDKSLKGSGFGFRLGKGEVIKGWDIGVKGMQVGGKRRITCPPQTAYGAKGSPPTIPPNSTLVFDVELRKVK